MKSESRWDGARGLAAAILSVASPVVSPVALAALAVIAATIAAISGAGFGGAAATLPPIFIFRGVAALAAAYGMLAAIFLTDGDEKRGSTAFAILVFIGILAGFSWGIIITGEGTLENAAFQALPVALTVAIMRKSFGGGRTPALIAVMAAALWFHAAPKISFSNTVFAYDWLTAMALSIALGLVAFVSGKINRSGLISGAALGTIIYTSMGPEGFAVLVSFVVIAVAATSAAGKAMKRDKAMEKRGFGNVAANIGPAACFAAISLLANDHGVFAAGYCAALGAALSDTVSAELGMMYGTRARDIRTLSPVTPGVNGAVSREGMVFGLLAAMFMALTAVSVNLTTVYGAMFVLIGSVAGNVVDSWLGSKYENSGQMGNDTVNFWATFTGGAVASSMQIAYTGYFV